MEPIVSWDRATTPGLRDVFELAATVEEEIGGLYLYFAERLCADLQAERFFTRLGYEQRCQGDALRLGLHFAGRELLAPDCQPEPGLDEKQRTLAGLLEAVRFARELAEEEECDVQWALERAHAIETSEARVMHDWLLTLPVDSHILEIIQELERSGNNHPERVAVYLDQVSGPCSC